VGRLRRHRALLGVGLLLVALFFVAVVVRPPATDDGPGGVAALRRLLEIRGVDVSSADAPGEGTFFLPHDLRTTAQAEPVLSWVRNGGRVVVADPGSAVLRGAGIRQGFDPVAGFVPEQVLRPDCLDPAIVGVDGVVAGALDATYRRPPDALGCFHRGDGAYLVRRRLGAGEVVAMGGLTPLTNEYLRQEDDVVLAWNLLGGTGETVVFGAPLPAGASAPPGLWGLLPEPARAIALQLVGAAVVFALARGRRLGRPIEEVLPAPIPATELVVATGDLYRRARATSHAAEVLRDRFRVRAGRRFGLGPAPDDAELARAVAGTTGPAEVRLDRRIDDERELVVVAGDLERLERQMEGGDGWATPERR
jgi:hypothetical protein